MEILKLIWGLGFIKIKEIKTIIINKIKLSYLLDNIIIKKTELGLLITIKRISNI